ncbi:hypothetical protein HHK36_019940 [Tetracentron sinense]|uniref:RRM domain-containing protein n=1 Tax=Tetracentron sinense TaxID=13715 RepID=A0A834YXZ0_TETSI|nr:hypothetical protein HHK36_019940 [Tetracentron sinense]
MEHGGVVVVVEKLHPDQEWAGGIAGDFVGFLKVPREGLGLVSQAGGAVVPLLMISGNDGNKSTAIPQHLQIGGVGLDLRPGRLDRDSDSSNPIGLGSGLGFTGSWTGWAWTGLAGEAQPIDKRLRFALKSRKTLTNRAFSLPDFPDPSFLCRSIPVPSIYLSAVFLALISRVSASRMPPPNKSNMLAEQNPRQIHGGKDADEDEKPSHNLWVGNLGSDITDSDLMDVFATHGALDSVTTYSSKSFAFVYFKHLEDARAAKDALQGTVIRGNPIKIEFARPVRSSLLCLSLEPGDLKQDNGTTSDDDDDGLQSRRQRCQGRGWNNANCNPLLECNIKMAMQHKIWVALKIVERGRGFSREIWLEKFACWKLEKFISDCIAAIASRDEKYRANHLSCSRSKILVERKRNGRGAFISLSVFPLSRGRRRWLIFPEGRFRDGWRWVTGVIRMLMPVQAAQPIHLSSRARPGKHLWVGGISSSVTKEQLEDEFMKFGKIEDFKFLRDRNSALVDYFRLEDAAAALKNMNRKRLDGEQIRVDFLRSQPSRRENWSDFHDSKDGRFNNRRSIGPPEPLWMPPDSMRNFPEPHQYGLKRHPPPQPLGGRREGQPSNVLWIGYPPSVKVDEQMLHNAMILFGEIERIRNFSWRHYSFVQFRSVDEARRAKEGLQGRLFNDPRVQILFSSSEFAPGKESPACYPGIKGPRPDMFFNDLPFGPGPMDLFSHNRPMALINFPGLLPPNVMHGPNMLVRPFGPQSGYDPLLSGPEFNDMADLSNFQDSNTNNSMGPNWRRLSPPLPGMLPSPAPGMWPPIRSTWDGFETNAFQRESKRSRIDGPPPIDDAPFPVRKMDNQGIRGDEPYGFGPQLNGDASGPLANAQGRSRHSPVGVRVSTGGPPGQGLPDNDYCWRGTIAKGGTPVCHARCVPIGKGIDSQLPEIVNCSARTGLDMLTKHYAEASGFDIVFFLPDVEDDFASYTEFLRYLSAKNRAGVAKFDDGTTLFLVPPSDFLTKVLNVSGPERLYGVVLKLTQQIPSNASIQQPLQSIRPPSHNIDRKQLPPLQTDYSLTPQKEDQVMQMNYNRVLHEDSMPHPPKMLFPPTDESHSVHSVIQNYANNAAAMPQAGVSLTPELIATLAALLPGNMQSSASTSAQFALDSSAMRSSLPASVTPEKAIPSQGWGQDHQATVSSTLHHSRDEQTGHSSQQLGHQFNTQAPLFPHFQAYNNVSNAPDQSAHAVLGSTQIQNPSLSLPQQGPISSRPLNNFVIPSQSGQFMVPSQANQQYQLDTSHSSQNSYGMVHATDASESFRPPVFQQPNPPVTSSNQVHIVNQSDPQLGIPLGTDKVNTELPNQVQQLQSGLSGAGQGTSEGEVDKNQRYQSTLQFAASLLLQIQQKQQQTNAQAMQCSGNQH